MRPPLEYGDNFPVPTGGWNPAEPWRFPKHEVLTPRQGLLGIALPWITLGLGVTLGILWMNWRMGLVEMRSQADLSGKMSGPRQEEVLRSLPAPKPAHFRVRSNLA